MANQMLMTKEWEGSDSEEEKKENNTTWHVRKRTGYWNMKCFSWKCYGIFGWLSIYIMKSNPSTIFPVQHVQCFLNCECRCDKTTENEKWRQVKENNSDTPCLPQGFMRYPEEIIMISLYVYKVVLSIWSRMLYSSWANI